MDSSEERELLRLVGDIRKECDSLPPDVKRRIASELSGKSYTIGQRYYACRTHGTITGVADQCSHCCPYCHNSLYPSDAMGRPLTPAEYDELMKYNEVKDSGERQEFATGSVRDTQEGKGRYDLITPIGLRRLAVHYENGAKKYGDRNWEKGQPLARYLESAIRHVYAFLGGARDEDHLSAAAWNILSCIHTEERIRQGLLPSTLDNLPPVLVDTGEAT